MLLPHLRDRAMVMKRYPHGAAGAFFFMKRAPTPRPAWIETCSIEHGSGNVIDFPMIQDRAALLWVVNLGCIDLNQWYARCDDVDRPDYLHFDLDPGVGATFERVLETARVVREALDALKMPSLVKTTGSKGLHVYVPIVRGPVQKQVWTFAKALAQELAARHPALITAEYRVAKRPRGRVLVDYNQNAWGRTLASIYSVRPRPEATVSTPVTWKEVEPRRPHRGLHGHERAGAGREARRSVEAAARRPRPVRPLTIRLTADEFDCGTLRQAGARCWPARFRLCGCVLRPSGVEGGVGARQTAARRHRRCRGASDCRPAAAIGRGSC